MGSVVCWGQGLYRIGSNFLEVFFTLLKSVSHYVNPASLVKVLRLFRLEQIVVVFRVWTQQLGRYVQHLIYWQGQRVFVCDPLFCTQNALALRSKANLYLGVWQVKTLILGLLVYKSKAYIYIYILDIISGLVPETGTGTGTGTDRRLWYCLRSDWFCSSISVPIPVLYTQVATCVLVQHWFLQPTAFYAQTIFPINFLVGPHLFPLFFFFLQNSQISY